MTSTVVMDNTPSFGIIFTMMATTAFPTAVTSPNMIPNENANVMFEARRAPIKAINPQNQIQGENISFNNILARNIPTIGLNNVTGISSVRGVMDKPV